MYKILAISDLHVSSNDKLVDGIPLNFILISNSIDKIISEEHPDIFIINGDIIDNVNKIDIPTISFLNMLITSISKQCPVYINTGNHDIVESGYTNENLSSISNVLNIFNGIKNVIPIKQVTKLNLLDSLFLSFIPYSKNIDMLYEQINNIYVEDFGYHLIFGHTDIDFVDVEISQIKHKNLFSYNTIENKFNKYHSFWGHYHIGKQYGNHNLSLISSLSPINFGDESKIHNIEDIDKNYMHGYYVIEFENTENVKYTFKQNTIGKRYITLDEQHILDNNSYEYLLNYIKSNSDMYFNFRINCNTSVIDEIQKRVSDIYIYNNIVQIQLIPLSDDISINMSNNIPDDMITKNNILDILIPEIRKIVDESEIDKYINYLKGVCI